MPIYVYHCANCDTQIEKRQGFADTPLTTCESCGGSVRRLLQPVGIIFKGSGFYTTDSRASSNGKKDGTNGEVKSTAENGAAAGESKKDGVEKATSTSGDKAASSSNGTSGGASRALATSGAAS